MTQGPSDARLGKPESPAARRRDKRVELLGRASMAIRQAHVTAENGASAHADAVSAAMTQLENEALREAERDALHALEADVRRFASQLRTEGTPPEVAVRRLKATVEPVVFATHDHDGGDVDWRRAVVGDVVRWFVESYYAA
jgi:hypothetical protein